MILQMRVMKNLLQILNFQRKMTKSQVIVLQCIKLNQDYDEKFPVPEDGFIASYCREKC